VYPGNGSGSARDNLVFDHRLGWRRGVESNHGPLGESTISKEQLGQDPDQVLNQRARALGLGLSDRVSVGRALRFLSSRRRRRRSCGLSTRIHANRRSPYGSGTGATLSPGLSSATTARLKSGVPPVADIASGWRKRAGWQNKTPADAAKWALYFSSEVSSSTAWA
jgi:hypothetical protein